jgi:disulfide bond formation protein DsbB
MVLLVVALTGCGGPPPPPPITPAPKGAAVPASKIVGDATRGRQLYIRTCVACHGNDAKGLPGLGKDLTNNPFVKNQPEPQLVDFLKKGRAVTDPSNTTKRDMPARGGDPTVTDQQLADIVAYMRSLP